MAYSVVLIFIEPVPLINSKTTSSGLLTQSRLRLKAAGNFILIRSLH